jgi:tRNA(fMet)-specific endonuclease VapC
MRYLLDTNVISELVSKRPNEGVIRWIDDVDPEKIHLSVITIGELSKGIEKLQDSSRKDTLKAWLLEDLLVQLNGCILPFDIEVMLTWGLVAGRLERVGRPLSAMDSLIAALALHHALSLVTRNENDFKDTGVTIVNPCTCVVS